MSGVTRSLCTFEDLRNQEHDGRRRLRLTLQDHSLGPQSSEPHRHKPVGRAYALVQPPSSRSPVPIPEPIKSKEEQVEVIKVYLEARKHEQQKHQHSLNMLSNEVSQIQEVRYSLKTLREQMAAKNKPNGWKVSVPFMKSTPSATKGGAKADGQEVDNEAERTRELCKRLYAAQLQEAEAKHQEERDRLQAESSKLRVQLDEQGERLRSAEDASERRGQRIEELQRLLGGMEKESAGLRETISSHEEELRSLRSVREDSQNGDERARQLEKELAVLKEKIHHLDDMLKCQQRKVRHMIEQLQNSRMVIQERDRLIKELEERVAFLEAENREMRDQIDYYLGGQRSSSSYLSTEHNPQIVYRNS